MKKILLFATFLLGLSATFAQNVQYVSNLAALRSLPAPTSGNPVTYVAGHTTAGDSGAGMFVWMTGSIYTDASSVFSVDNNGTIIKPTSSNTGRWIRQFDGYINVAFFGAFGRAGYDGPLIQKAIDFAEQNVDVQTGTYQYSPYKGSTVFIPAGGYVVDKLILKNKVSIIGDSSEGTIIYGTNSGDGANFTNTPYMIEMENGYVELHMSNLNFSDRGTPKGCLHFNSNNSAGAGLQLSTFKNIKINNFGGIGLYLQGGESDFLHPNQFCVFENVRVKRRFLNDTVSYVPALKMTGQQGQISFINCTFDGNNQDTVYNNGANAEIFHVSGKTSGVVSFINSTFQDSDYGLNMDYAENITIDNCWFENLGVAITVNGSLPNYTSKSINIVNNRFANAGGFGVLNVSMATNLKWADCIQIFNSNANIQHNYTTPFRQPATEGGLPRQNKFVLVNVPSNIIGVNASENMFVDYNTNFNGQIRQSVTGSSGVLESQGSKFISVSSSSVIHTLKTYLNTGEQLTVIANGTIGFSNSGNISLGNRSSLGLSNNESAIFVRDDDLNNVQRYRLVSIVKTSSP